MYVYFRYGVCEKEEKQWQRNFLVGKTRSQTQPLFPVCFIWFIKVAAFL